MLYFLHAAFFPSKIGHEKTHILEKLPLFKGQNRADELFSYIEVSTVLIRNSEDPTF